MRRPARCGRRDDRSRGQAAPRSSSPRRAGISRIGIAARRRARRGRSRRAATSQGSRTSSSEQGRRPRRLRFGERDRVGPGELSHARSTTRSEAEPARLAEADQARRDGVEQLDVRRSAPASSPRGSIRTARMTGSWPTMAARRPPGLSCAEQRRAAPRRPSPTGRSRRTGRRPASACDASASITRHVQRPRRASGSRWPSAASSGSISSVVTCCALCASSAAM